MIELQKQFQKEQAKWISKLSLKNNFQKGDIKLVAGVDIAYWKNQEKEYGVCCIVVIDYETREVVEKVDYFDEIHVPYISGYLAFRELPLVLHAVQILTRVPDLYMFDGNGYLHNCHMGIATHASFYLNRPTIGVAKNYLKIDGAEFDEPKNELGASELIQVENEVYGIVLRTRKDVKPIYVSCGNWIDLETAKTITLHFVNKESRLPITTRYADLETHSKRKKYLSFS
ncbi:MAG: endonuclease V [Longicatena sp.]